MLVGGLRLDAALTAAPPPGRKIGPRLPTPADLAADAAVPWSHTRVVLDGRARTVRDKTCVAHWYRPFGAVALRVVVVQWPHGERKLRAFVCTAATWSVPALLRAYADRWPTEPTFRDCKQLLGFAHSAAWTRRAVERTAPMIGLLYTLLVVWFHDTRRGDALDVIPHRPWYPARRTISFGDVLRAAQDTFARIDLPAKLPHLEDFARRGARPRSGDQLPLPFAA